MYQALYRKYRSRTFDEVVGQRSVTQTLKTQVSTGRLSHAYLFTGTRGTGKTSCAKILARAVNCEHPVDGNPCNCCAACRSIEEGSCMDVLEIDAASNNGVDQVRALRDDAIYSPSQVRRRVYIIDEVHMLSLSAFNALLKIIEEPPEHLMFILATTEQDKVPATILSRCQRFSFRRLGLEDISGRIRYVAYQEGIDLMPDAGELLARLADGALRDGLSLLDQCASTTPGTLTVEAVTDCLGLAGRFAVRELMEEIGARNTAAALTRFAGLYEGGKDVRSLLSELCSAARDVLIFKEVPDGGLLTDSGLFSAEELARLSSAFSRGELLRMVALLQELLAGRAKSLNLRADAELCLIRLCNPALQNDFDSLLARMTRIEERLASGMPLPAPETAKPAAPESVPAAPADTRPEDVRDDAVKESGSSAPDGFWPELCEAMQVKLPAPAKGFFAIEKKLLRYKLTETDLLIAGGAFELSFLTRPETHKTITETSSALVGRPLRVSFREAGGAMLGGKDPLDSILDRADAFGDKITVR